MLAKTLPCLIIVIVDKTFLDEI